MTAHQFRSSPFFAAREAKKTSYAQHEDSGSIESDLQRMRPANVMPAATDFRLGPAMPKSHHGMGVLSATGGIPPRKDDSLSGEHISQSELAARIAATEARTDAKLADMLRHSDAKFAEMMGKLETSTAVTAERFNAMQSELHNVTRATQSAKNTFIVTAIGSVLAIAALIVALLSFGGQMFSSGMSAKDIISKTVSETVNTLDRSGQTPGKTPAPPVPKDAERD